MSVRYSPDGETQHKNKKGHLSSRAVYPGKVENKNSLRTDGSLPPALGEASDILYFEFGRQKRWATVRRGGRTSIRLPAVLKVSRKRDIPNLAVLSRG